MNYLVTDRDGLEVLPGDTVTDFRGDTAVFLAVTRGVEYNGTAKVLVRDPDGWEVNYSDRVFGLTVTTIRDGK